MRYPAAETAEKHDRILNEAARMFRERGFSAVSVSEIMKAAGLTHGPFYNHFTSKEALMAECLEYGMRAKLADLDKINNSRRELAEYLDRYLGIAHRDLPGEGCMVAALASEVRNEPQVRGSFTLQVKAFVEKIASIIPGRTKRSARADSIRMLASMVGALILARSVDDESFSQEILRAVRKGIV